LDSPLVIFREMHAESFVRGAEHLLKTLGRGLETPALNCAALGAELSLKALLARRDIDVWKEHNLASLLDKLPADDRQAIVARTAEKFPDFDAQLVNAARAFVDWRYIYEAKEEMRINFFFVAALARAIAERLETVRGYPMTLNVNYDDSRP
jgi:HEPN domain-containing protein